MKLVNPITIGVSTMIAAASAAKHSHAMPVKLPENPQEIAKFFEHQPFTQKLITEFGGVDSKMPTDYFQTMSQEAKPSSVKIVKSTPLNDKLDIKANTPWDELQSKASLTEDGSCNITNNCAYFNLDKDALTPISTECRGGTCTGALIPEELLPPTPTEIVPPQFAGFPPLIPDRPGEIIPPDKPPVDPPPPPPPSNPVPEPSTLALFGVGLMALANRLRRVITST